jgi:hypothetical protein
MGSRKYMEKGELHVVRFGGLVVHLHYLTKGGDYVRVTAYDDSGRQTSFYIQSNSVVSGKDVHFTDNNTTVKMDEGDNTWVPARALKKLFHLGVRVATAQTFVEQVAIVQHIHEYMSNHMTYMKPSKWLLGGGEE